MSKLKNCKSDKTKKKLKNSKFDQLKTQCEKTQKLKKGQNSITQIVKKKKIKTQHETKQKN